MALTKVTLVGANGKLGPAILHAVLSAGTFNVTVLSRSSSKSRYPDSVHDLRTSDDPSTEELKRVLQGQDALVVVFAGSNKDLQIRYANAAAQAGVKRFIPADFGSCDSSSPRALELVPLYRTKTKVRQHLQQLASNSQLSWTSLVNGHFFDYGLTSGLLQFDLKNRKALIFDDGNVIFSATTLDTIGLAVARVLQREEGTKNRMLYIQSVCVSQNELLRSLERLSGKEWTTKHVSADEYIKQTQAKLDQNPNDAEEWENMVSVVGIVDTNWTGKDEFANSLLGLPDEDLDQVLRGISGVC
ncbi:hypothetical protein ACLMJK_001591 [Lecanora helva]